MRIVEYKDVPWLCAQLLREVELTGATMQIVKDGHAIAFLQPVSSSEAATYGSLRGES